ncbi:unnamed protein product [Allacma fusca]|uniref:Spaetzle domain-containing protein n=1 Tax=Allacma fusca TaxID=39272 RepID=A0A8J2NSK2_9HEXA|nr:unnamed protein product [Allacma fusca]
MVTARERLDFFLVAIIFVGHSFGNEYMMTCSRPIVSKTPRLLKLDLGLPCDLSRESWCNLPGDKYPWHAVRSFVFENQGLMRRMYGEVRQLSVLRMEFNGNSIDENNSVGREFDELFKPVNPTTTSTSPPLVTQFSTESPTTPDSSRTTKVPNNESPDSPDKTVSSPLSVSSTSDVVTGSPLKYKSSDDGYPSDPPVSTTDGSGLTEGTTIFDPRISDDETDVGVTTEAVQHILFQDAEKATTVKSRTTTEEAEVDVDSAAAADAPQQIHRSDIKGVNACPVKEEVVAPYWANNTRGEVLALLNLYPFEQYIHWEKCTFEHRQMYCREGCRCEQQYRLHRLLAFDPTNECRGIFSDWFRFPSCCVCKCYLTSSDLAQERFSFNRSPRLDDSDVPDVNGVDDSHFYYKSTGYNSRQPR